MSGRVCSSCGMSPRVGLRTVGDETLCVECRASKRDLVAARTTVELLPAGALSLERLRREVDAQELKLIELDHSEMPRRSEVIFTQGRLIAAYRALVMEMAQQARRPE